MILTDVYEDLKKIVGAEHVSAEPAVLDSYVWQSLPGEDADIWLQRPLAVVLPGSAEEVLEVVRICREADLKCVAYATGWGVFGAPTSEDVVQLDLTRMNRILEIDPENLVAVVEPGVCAAQLQAEAFKLGLNLDMPPDGPCGSPLSAGLSALEYVSPEGETVRRSDTEVGAEPIEGIFIRGTVKLREWPGPAGLDMRGLLFDAEMEIPESIRFYLCFFPDATAETEAGLALENEHVGYLTNYAAFGSLVYCLAPNLFGALAETETLGGLLRKVLGNACAIMLAGAMEDLQKQETSLREIVERFGGIMLGTQAAPRLTALLIASHLRAAAVPRAGRGWGTPSTFLEQLQV